MSFEIFNEAFKYYPIWTCSLFAIVGIIYFYFYMKRRKELKHLGVVRAILDYLIIMVILLFVILSFYLIFNSLKNHSYGPIILAVAWLYMSYHLVMIILIHDFKIVTTYKRFKIINKLNKIYFKVTDIILYIMLICFTLAGIYLSATSISSYSKEIHHYDYKNITGTVNLVIPAAENKNQYIYKYEVGNKQYFIESKPTSEILKVGSKKIIKYNPSNPEQSYIAITDINIIGIILGLTTVISSIMIVNTMLKKKSIAEGASVVIPSMLLGNGLLLYYLDASNIGIYNPFTLLISQPSVILVYLLLIISVIILFRNSKNLR